METLELYWKAIDTTKSEEAAAETRRATRAFAKHIASDFDDLSFFGDKQRIDDSLAIELAIAIVDEEKWRVAGRDNVLRALREVVRMADAGAWPKKEGYIRENAEKAIAILTAHGKGVDKIHQPGFGPDGEPLRTAENKERWA